MFLFPYSTKGAHTDVVNDFLIAKSSAHFEVHSFIQQMVIEHPLCAKHCSELSEYNSE